MTSRITDTFNNFLPISNLNCYFVNVCKTNSKLSPIQHHLTFFLPLPNTTSYFFFGINKKVHFFRFRKIYNHLPLVLKSRISIAKFRKYVKFNFLANPYNSVEGYFSDLKSLSVLLFLLSCSLFKNTYLFVSIFYSVIAIEDAHSCQSKSEFTWT